MAELSHSPAEGGVCMHGRCSCQWSSEGFGRVDWHLDCICALNWLLNGGALAWRGSRQGRP